MSWPVRRGREEEEGEEEEEEVGGGGRGVAGCLRLVSTDIAAIEQKTNVLHIKEEGGRRKEEGGRRKEEGGRRKKEGGRRKEEGGRRKEEGRQKEGKWKQEGGGGKEAFLTLTQPNSRSPSLTKKDRNVSGYVSWPKKNSWNLLSKILQMPLPI
jgi:ATP-dependent RNA helicase DHX57